MPDPLTDLERTALDIELQWWRWTGPKEQAIRERTGLSTARFYQLLSRLADDERAIAVEPALCARLRRRREAGRRVRSARRLGMG